MNADERGSFDLFTAEKPRSLTSAVSQRPPRSFSTRCANISNMRSRPLLLATLLGVRAWAQPATLAGFSDNGAFVLYVNEERLGRLTFEWKADGAFESKLTMSLAGQSADGIVVLTPDAEGRWIKAVVDDASPQNVWEP